MNPRIATKQGHIHTDRIFDRNSGNFSTDCCAVETGFKRPSLLSFHLVDLDTREDHLRNIQHRLH